jgi:hypothetical protein
MTQKAETWQTYRRTTQNQNEKSEENETFAPWGSKWWMEHYFVYLSSKANPRLNEVQG